MKKLSLVLACLFAVSAMAWANDVNWYVNWGVYSHDATDLVTTESGAILDNYDVLWQLIYAGQNNTIDPIDVNNTAGGYVSGDDEVLGTLNIDGARYLSNGNSGIFDNYLYTEDYVNTVTSLSYTYSESNPYYVYQRIYESQTPQAGTYYYQSELTKLDSDYGEIGTQTIGLGPMASGIQPNLQVNGASVPEPATMGLMGLGALAMVLRRKLRK